MLVARVYPEGTAAYIIHIGVLFGNPRKLRGRFQKELHVYCPRSRPITITGYNNNNNNIDIKRQNPALNPSEYCSTNESYRFGKQSFKTFQRLPNLYILWMHCATNERM